MRPPLSAGRSCRVVTVGSKLQVLAPHGLTWCQQGGWRSRWEHTPPASPRPPSAPGGLGGTGRRKAEPDREASRYLPGQQRNRTTTPIPSTPGVTISFSASPPERR